MAEFCHYHEISSRLRKRFNLIRKPNLREASDSFRHLSTDLKDFSDYAGFCMFSAAKCEHQIVGSLKEQLTHSAGSTTNNSSIPSRTHMALERLLYTASWNEFQTWMDTARKLKENKDDFNAVIYAYAHAMQTCSSSKFLITVITEFANFYKSHEKYLEASEIYIEGNLYREAADCLLRGNYFEDAYYCYQQLFRQYEKNDLFSHNNSAFTITKKSLISSSNLATSSNKLPSINLTSIFSKKTEQRKSKLAEDDLTEPSPLFYPYIHHITIDDYITVFLLHLYLYDPLKYEYPSPIIPLPELFPGCYCNPFEENDAEVPMEERIDLNNDFKNCLNSDKTTHNETKISTFISDSLHNSDMPIIKATYPFIDVTNENTIKRSISDLVELNFLLETLYLSYRNELKHTVDNDYFSDTDKTDEEDDSEGIILDFDNFAVEKHGKDKTENTLEEFNIEHEQSTKSDLLDLSKLQHCLLARQESHDSTTTTTTTTTDDDRKNYGIPRKNQFFSQEIETCAYEKTSPKALDDASLRLKQLAMRYGDCSSLKTVDCFEQNEEIESANFEKTEFSLKLKRMLRKCNMQSQKSILSNEARIRNEISIKLYPMLNSHQNQLLYIILKNKD